MTIFRKVINGRKGTWNKYIARIKINGKEETVQVKFGRGAGEPEGDFPRDIEVDKDAANIRENKFTMPDGSEGTAKVLWVNRWTDGGVYKDPVMQQVEF